MTTQEKVKEALAKKDSIITQRVIKDYLFTSKTKLSEQQQAMFAQLALRNQLDPFKREIYAIAYGTEFNIVTGYQVYIQRAEATGKLDGWECVAIHDKDKKALIGAKITIYRKDFSHPFIWEVSLREFDKGHGLWNKMPEFLIKKVCIGQGFRLAFPNELGGMPYLAEEMEGVFPSGGKTPIEKVIPKDLPVENSTSLAPQEQELPAGEGEEMVLKTHSASPSTPINPEASLIEGMIENITSKKGVKNGKEWQSWTIHIVGGDKYGTFSKTISQNALKAKEFGMKVEILYKDGKFGHEILEMKSA